MASADQTQLACAFLSLVDAATKSRSDDPKRLLDSLVSDTVRQLGWDHQRLLAAALTAEPGSANLHVLDLFPDQNKRVIVPVTDRRFQAQAAWVEFKRGIGEVRDERPE